MRGPDSFKTLLAEDVLLSDSVAGMHSHAERGNEESCRLSWSELRHYKPGSAGGSPALTSCRSNTAGEPPALLEVRKSETKKPSDCWAFCVKVCIGWKLGCHVC